ncbi:hypothetical protein F4775DRAFT_39642 [Biscogniauxia sp. FL1348]|nr:hypothetical protein F4775DRAFT_39642 [Biscogniauxia sp. FL1348]
MWYPLNLGLMLQARQENTGLIYTTPGDSVNGSFIFPRTWPMNFRETSTINISWTSTYEGVSLYFYQRGKVANSTQIAKLLKANLATDWYQWEVKTDETNLTEPFVFRIVNARGTAEEAALGGFWSTSFFILRDATESATTSPVSSSTSISLSSSPPPSSSSSSSSYGLLSTITITPSITPSSTTLPTETTQPAPVQTSGLSPGTIAGISVAGVVGVVGILAAACIWHRKEKSKKARQQPRALEPPPPVTTYETYKPWPHELHTAPPELPSAQVYYELPPECR